MNSCYAIINASLFSLKYITFKNVINNKNKKIIWIKTFNEKKI